MTIRQGRGSRLSTILALCLGVFVFAVVAHSLAFAQGSPIVVGISPLTSKVSDIPAEAAQDLFINALMDTNLFVIRPPDANGSYAGSAYVLEPTISEAKAKGNVIGFLKDVATSKSSISLTVRVFDPRTSALLKSVTVKSTDTGTQVSLGDVQSLMGALGAGKGGEEGTADAPDETAQLEERLGGLMQQAATKLAAQLGGGATGALRPGIPQRR